MRARRHPFEPAAQAHTRIRQSYKALVTERAHMAQLAKPNVVYHADWSSIAAKRSCARVVLGTDGRYTALAPEPVGIPGSLIAKLRQETGGNRVRLRWVRFSDWRPGLLCRACWHIELPHPASQFWNRRLGEFLFRLRQAPTKYACIDPSTRTARTRVGEKKICFVVTASRHWSLCSAAASGAATASC